MTNFSRRKALAGLMVFASGTLSPVLAMDMAREIEAENAIRDSRQAAARIARIRGVPGVGIVNLNFPSGPYQIDRDFMEPGDFRLLADRHADSVSRLRRALRANPVTRAALADQGVDASAIVGVRISSNGALRLFVLN